MWNIGVIFVTLSLCVSCALCAVAAPPAGNLIPIAGTSSWAIGINYPWNNYGADFGSNAWGYTGVAVASEKTKVTNGITDIHNRKARVIRIWLFADGRAGITFDSTGKPTGIDAKVYDDVTALLQIAKNTKTYIVFSLFDFLWLQKKSVVSGVSLGGHKDTITDSTKLSALITNVVTPLFIKFKSDPNILAWEIMNEPEWVISDLPQASVNSDVESVTLAQFFNFASKVSAAAHANTNHYVTLGSASLKWYKVWTPAFATQKSLPKLNLDFYQTHYYSWMNGYCLNNDANLGTVCFDARAQNVSALKLDRPIVLGEYDSSSGASTLLETFYKNGFAGAWPWSYKADFSVDWSGYTSWANSRQSITKWV